jgi:hypothetical protein
MKPTLTNQKVFWKGTFDYMPSLHGPGECYPGVPLQEHQDATELVV